MSLLFPRLWQTDERTALSYFESCLVPIIVSYPDALDSCWRWLSSVFACEHLLEKPWRRERLEGEHGDASQANPGVCWPHKPLCRPIPFSMCLCCCTELECVAYPPKINRSNAFSIDEGLPERLAVSVPILLWIKEVICPFIHMSVRAKLLTTRRVSLRKKEKHHPTCHYRLSRNGWLLDGIVVKQLPLIVAQFTHILIGRENR